jgi:hypothetical protein
MSIREKIENDLADQNIIALDPHGRVMMTRDNELIRRILLDIFKAKKDVVPRPIKIDGVDRIVLGRHLEMLLNEGLIEGIISQSGMEDFAYVRVKDMSMKGHDFLAVLENDTVWNKIKQKFSPPN